jgi:hypothetical protein
MTPSCQLRQDFPVSGEEGAMTAAYVRLVPVFVVFAGWSVELVVILVTPKNLCTIVIYY